MLHTSNAWRNNNKPQDNTISSWLLTCACPNKLCQCNARLKPNFLLVINHPHNKPPPHNSDVDITIQYVEFTYCNDCFPLAKIVGKETKYAPLLEDIHNNGWNIAPLIITIAGTRRAIHQTTKTQLNQNLFKLKSTTLKRTLKAIHHNAVKFFMHIILIKQKIKNKQLFPQDLL